MLLFLLQLIVILAASRAAGSLFRKLGQPPVIGEMVAGILLGPSLLGWLAPAFHQSLFPQSSLGFLNLTGQLGLIFYMFLVGLTLNLQHLREHYTRALVISLSCISFPFALGMLLAFSTYHRLSLPGVPLTAFALFLGVSMSITAFPVLARILRETGMADTRLGATAIACAAVDDVSAWMILAAILGFVRSPEQHWPFWQTLAMLGAYVAAMLSYHFLAAGFRIRLASALLIALVSSYATEWIGVHALFGAFFAGVAMPKTQEFVEEARLMIEPLTTSVLLPVFFALTGLRTRLSLAIGPDSWIYTLVIIAVAIIGKWLAAFVVGRWTGMNYRDANALGILMNTRGLVELVILNIGFELGILSPAVFSMMVIMAVVTTLMTTPLIRRAYPVQ